MRTRAKQKHVASDRARRENVPRHILFHADSNRRRRRISQARFFLVLPKNYTAVSHTLLEQEERKLDKKKYYITTAIAYTSGKPHIGNTYEAVSRQYCKIQKTTGI